MRKNILLILFVLIGTFSKGQYVFQKVYSYQYEGMDLKQTSDGKFIFCGYVYDGSFYDMLIIKYDTNGDTLWTKTYGGNNHDAAGSIEETNDGGFIICGFSLSFGSGFENEVYLVKIDSVGNLLWSTAFGGASYESARSIKQTIDNGFILTGTTESFGAGSEDIYLLKTDSIGNLLWTKTFGGISYDEAFNVEQTNDNGFIISATTASFGSGVYDGLLIKTDNLGNIQWNKTYGGTSIDYLRHVQQTNDNGYLLTGYTRSYTPGMYEFFMIKTDSAGNVSWAKRHNNTIGMGGSYTEELSDGSYISTGHFDYGSTNRDVCLLKADVNGNVSWTKSYSTNAMSLFINQGDVVHQTNDNGYLLLAHNELVALASLTPYIIKTDSLGFSGCADSTISVSSNNFSPTVTSPVLSVSTGGSTFAAITSTGYIFDTIANSCSGTIGITEINSEESFSLFPNPTNEILTISTKDFENSSIQIFDLTGKLMLNETMNQEEKQINIGQLSSGMYFVQFQNGNKFIGKRFVKE